MKKSAKNKNQTNPVLSSRDFKYNFKFFCQSLFRFPMVHFLSKRYCLELYRFLQTYPRSGSIVGKKGQPILVNTVEHYLDDAQNRGLVDLNFIYQNHDLNRIQEVEILNGKQGKISALTLTQPDSKKWVIGLHGWTENKYLALRQTYLYSQLGYNILTFDARGHGNSPQPLTDIGYSIPQDVTAVLSWLEKTYDVEAYGVIGNSMGGAGAMKFALDSGYQDPRCKFIVDDAGFNHLIVELRYVMQWQFKNPWWKISHHLGLFLHRQLKIDALKYDLLKNLDRLKDLPVLFIHGLDDDFIPAFHSQELYQAKVKSEKLPASQLLTAPGVKHVQMISLMNPLYQETIKNFLTSIGEI